MPLLLMLTGKNTHVSDPPGTCPQKLLPRLGDRMMPLFLPISCFVFPLISWLFSSPSFASLLRSLHFSQQLDLKNQDSHQLTFWQALSRRNNCPAKLQQNSASVLILCANCKCKNTNCFHLQCCLLSDALSLPTQNIPEPIFQCTSEGEIRTLCHASICVMCDLD